MDDWSRLMDNFLKICRFIFLPLSLKNAALQEDYV